MTFRGCVMCNERFCRVDPDYRAGRCTRLFCSDCVDAVQRSRMLCDSRPTDAKLAEVLAGLEREKHTFIDRLRAIARGAK